MAFFNEFPHTHYYDTDLAWLIKRMKEVLSRMDSVEARMKALEDLVADFIASLNIEQAIKDALQEMVDQGVFNDLIENLFNQYITVIDGRLDSLEDDLNNIINNFINQTNQRITAIESSLTNYYTKSEIDGMLGGVSDLITDLDSKIINSASKSRAIISVRGGNGTGYQYVLGTVNILRGRIDVGSSSSQNFMAYTKNTHNDIIYEITLFDEVYSGLNISINRFYDICNIIDAKTIVYQGMMNTSLPPYTGFGGLAFGSLAINHIERTNDNLFMRGYPMTGSPVFVLLLGLVANVNGVYGDRGFPTNEQIKTLITP